MIDTAVRRQVSGLSGQQRHRLGEFFWHLKTPKLETASGSALADVKAHIVLRWARGGGMRG
jgi:hypothetical protein